MNTRKQLPVCWSYITAPNRADIIYTLTKLNSKTTLSEDNCHSLLYAAGIITKKDTLPQIIKNISCFTIVTEYKCGYICYLCPMSTCYKNKLEEKESMLFSYALKNWQNLRFLRKHNVSSKTFQSLFLINKFPSGKIVATLPLLRLSFHFLEQSCNQDTDFSSLPMLISLALEKGNPEKLLPQNIHNIKEFLSCLQENYQNIEEEAILKLIQSCLEPSSSTEISSKPTKNSLIDGVTACMATKEPILNNHTQSSSVPECLDGLLGMPKLTTTNNNKKVNFEIQIRKNQVSAKEKEHLTTTLPNKETLQFYTSPNIELIEKPNKILLPETTKEESLYLPFSFSVKNAENTGYPFHIVEENFTSLQQFESFLLYNPKLALEIVTDEESGKDALLFCAAGLFYYVFTDNETVINLLSNYISKSTIRRQICLEPYRLYSFLQKNKLNYQNVFSLRTAYKVIAKSQKRNSLKSPASMVKELASRTNSYRLSPHIFSMLHYVKMCDVLESTPLFCKKEHQQEYQLLCGIDTLLGISYELKEIANTKEKLFNMNEKREYQFTYEPDLKMKHGIYSVTFNITTEKPINCLVSNILFRFAKQNLSNIYGYRLLRFNKNSFTIATTEKNYSQLCEIVNNLSTYLASQQELLPLIIKEDLYK